jgi:hypothetical protein
MLGISENMVSKKTVSAEKRSLKFGSVEISSLVSVQDIPAAKSKINNE